LGAAASLLGSKGFDQLFQELRHAVIYYFHALRGLEPFGDLVPTTSDQDVTIRGQTFVEHRWTLFR
jgi:hypothetical protein